ncbi:energy-coupling factor transporter ATPase [Brevibacillus sp. SYP-B805]|uniref:energy-coupling factor transporter ATPase n=1 Tax=Brevibacillus sp. SYP-B805 TaxID=1578199 RepID=UPI0013ED9B5D|nr:energy-coupling factor transporter ATPase [Brevibacillus sp. SYP-B805]NGQ97215.1 energy-coupling factor transporter ATPase [Brevibacillus sp. SYP-B805]
MQIAFENVSYTYGKGTPFAKEALSLVNLSIPSGAFVGIIGRTGSGKSTLIQHLNGLLKPTAGIVRVGEWTISPDTKVPVDLRQHVGLVFQYPEHQLFEETVAKDVAFGPLNFGLPREVAMQRVREALEIVGLSYEEMKERSPFHLSGGQMRRVAIAGILAMQPRVLVLDEPTAGLDPAGRREILDNIYRIHREQELTTLLVTHSMEEAARYADLLVVMADGRIAMQGPPAAVFAEADRLRALSLDVPAAVSLVASLNRCLPPERQLPASLYREEDVRAYLANRLKRGEEARR